MKTHRTLRMLARSVLLLSTFTTFYVVQLSTALAQSTAFTYQGQLVEGGFYANGFYDLEFTLYNDAVSGSALGVLTNTATEVVDGLFTAALDFGPGVFDGSDLWLEIGAVTNGGGSFSILSPRQSVTATPYAIKAFSSANAEVLSGTVSAGQVTGTIPLAQLPTTVITNGTINATLSGTFSGDGSGMTGLPNGSALDAADGSPTQALIVDNNGLVGIGTTSPVASLDIRRNSGTALYIEQTGTGSAEGIRATTYSPDAKAIVGTASGGGNQTAIYGETAGNDGWAGYFQGRGYFASDVGMGTTTPTARLDIHQNGGTAMNVEQTSVGTATGIRAITYSPDARAIEALASGGGNQTAIYAETAGSDGWAGYFAGRGYFSDDVGMGTATPAARLDIHKNGGTALNIEQTGAGTATGVRAITYSPDARAIEALASGGGNQTAIYAETAGNDGWAGYFQGRGFFAGDVGIGTPNPGAAVTISRPVQASAYQLELRNEGSIQSPNFDGIQFTQGSAGGTELASIKVKYVNSGNPDMSFSVRGIADALFIHGAYNGQNGNVGIGTTSPSEKLHVVGNIYATGTITPSSDRNLKKNFDPVNALDVLERVSSLPIQQWTYKAEADAVRHVGPMAQDFHAAFGYGANDITIATVDADGVALAAIQGLNEKVEAESQQTEDSIQKLKAENAALRVRLEKLERLLNSTLEGGAL